MTPSGHCSNAPVAGFKILKLLSNKFRQACNSFTEDAPVWSESGLTPIGDLGIDDKVWAFNEATGEMELQEIVHLIQRSGTYTLVHLTTESGEVINATDGHPVFVKGEAGWEWRDAGDIEAGAVVRDAKGAERHVVKVEKSEFTGPVFNLTVANDHTYFVGRDRVLVHNAKICQPPIVHWDHILTGNFNSKGRFNGFHYLEGGIVPSGRIIQKTGKSRGEFYEAYVFAEQTPTNYVPKKLNGGVSTFFPDSWPASKVKSVIMEAYQKTGGKGGEVDLLDLLTPSDGGIPGIRIKIGVSGNEIVQAYPIILGAP